MKLKVFFVLSILSISNSFAGITNNSPVQKSWSADNGNGTYTNPLFYDEFSDPDIIRVGHDYYLAGTTMHCVPGIVILHSTDLVNWNFCSYCFKKFDDNSPEFNLRNGKDVYGQGIWAPCIRYNKGKFYVFSNINGHGLQVYVADNIKGPWIHKHINGNIYDLSVLFDDDGKIYAIHKYGNVTCTQLKSDLSGPIEGTEKIIIPEGNAMGEGHHIYKINGMYYIISADYSPMGRMQCARSKDIYGPYETCVISERESFGYSAAWTTGNVGLGSPIPEDGFKFVQNKPSENTLYSSTIHQGGIVQAEDGKWWGISMQDFNAVGRATCLSPITWTDGWPYFGLEKNLGRSPRTWFKPNNSIKVPTSPYERSDNFGSKDLKPVWQWNHNPDDQKWSLTEKRGVLRLHTMAAKQLLFARNSLTQRAIGPVSIVTVKMNVSKLKDGDNTGLGIINSPSALLGVIKEKNKLFLRWYNQSNNEEIKKDLDNNILWLRLWGNYDESKVQYSYSFDNKSWTNIGDTIITPYQLKTFQGVRYALYAYNTMLKDGGYTDFDDFIVEEPLADRSGNIPYGKTIRLFNLSDGNPMYAMPHGMIYSTWISSNDYKSDRTKFIVIDKGNGIVNLQCADGRYLYVAGAGLSGDLRLTKDKNEAEDFVWQDMLRGQCMLLSLKTERYVYKHPNDGSPYSVDCQGPDANRRNGCVFKYEIVK